MNTYERDFLEFTQDWRNPVGVAALAVVLFVAFLYWEQTRFMIKSLRRNLLRSVLTGLATFILVLVVTMIWSVLAFLDKMTEAKSKNLKAIVSERYQMPSQMPIQYEQLLAVGAGQYPGDYRIDAARDSMFWAFYLGTLDPNKKLTRESVVFFFAMDPRKLISVDAQGNYISMMEGVDEFPDEDKRMMLAACEEMVRTPNKVLIGPDRLRQMNKKVGEKFKVMGTITYDDLDLEFEIMGELPGQQYEGNAVMNYAYLARALDSYEKTKGKKHPMADRSLSFEWLRVPDMGKFDQVAQQISTSPQFKSPAVKCETASSALSSFFDSFRDILFGMRWLLAPAILATMSLVIANAISISVRERRTEMAVLKVLGYSPNQIMILVLGEALLIGATSGVVSATLVKYIVNDLLGGLPLQIGFIPKFFVAHAAPWWGLTIGAGTALAGSILPAWTARSVKVAEVFAKVA